MIISEPGVSNRSVRYFFTPSSFAERIFFYPTRIGHYFCDRQYRFSCQSDIGQQASHHLNYMLMLIRQGQMRISMEAEQATLSRNDFVLFDCRRPHEYCALTDDLEFYWLLFNGAQSDLLYSAILEQHGGSHVIPATDPAQSQLLLTRLLTYGEMAQHIPERICSETIYSILCRLLLEDAAGVDASLTERAVSFMDRHFDAALTVDEVASHIGLSASYFTKLFRAHTGYSPYEYLTLRRIHRAKELLLSSALTVKQIAFECGYHSEENFIRVFKKKVGLSPSGFRRYPV